MGEANLNSSEGEKQFSEGEAAEWSWLIGDQQV